MDYPSSAQKFLTRSAQRAEDRGIGEFKKPKKDSLKESMFWFVAVYQPAGKCFEQVQA